MANFSSFFPVAAAGGGGFTKMKKISTNDSTDETTDKLLPNIGLKAQVNNLGASLTTNVYYENDGGFDFTAEGALVGYTYTASSGGVDYIHTITASGANTGTYDPFNITMSVNVSGASSIYFNWWAADPAKTMNAGPKTINPASDLGLSDGDSIGFLLAGGNATGVLRGTAIITTASTDLVCTPGLSSGTASTITGGLTLTSADGSVSNSIGYLSTVENSGYSSFMRTRVAAGQGIDGYGVGQQFSGTQSHGFGGYGVDGAVLLYY